MQSRCKLVAGARQYGEPLSPSVARHGPVALSHCCHLVAGMGLRTVRQISDVSEDIDGRLGLTSNLMTSTHFRAARAGCRMRS